MSDFDKLWTKADDDMLIKGRADGLTMKAISILIGNRTAAACQKRADKIGLQKKTPSRAPLRSFVVVRQSAPPPLTVAEKERLLWGDVSFENDVRAANKKTFAKGMDIPSHNLSLMGSAAGMVGSSLNILRGK